MAHASAIAAETKASSANLTTIKYRLALFFVFQVLLSVVAL